MYAPGHWFLLTVALHAPLSAQAPTDTARLRRQLGEAARAYEHALRAYAPFGPGIPGGTCDEQVGRFCVAYDRGRPGPLPAEPKRVVEARSRVIAAFRRGLEGLVGDSLVVAPLVRYLVEADSAAAAVAVATRAQGNWLPLLSGFARFHDRQIEDAEADFARATEVLGEKERKRAVDPYVLLAPGERSRFRGLSASEQRAYAERLWRLADPLYLTPGNEAVADHLARYVWSRILARAPVVSRSLSWGWDIEELTRRFGVPKARTRQATSTLAEDAVTDWFDPQQMTYVPPELSKRALVPYEPGAAWPYDTIRARSGFAPPTVRNMAPLEHQLSFLRARRETVLRVDAQLALDTAVQRPARVQFGLFVLDSAYRVIGETRVESNATTDTARAVLELPLPADAFAYSLEALEPVSRLAGRSRYVLDNRHNNALFLSDPILLRGDAALPDSRDQAQALTTLVLRRNQRIAVYLEAVDLRSTDYRVEVRLEEAKRPGALTRALRRVGELVGIDRVRPRVNWSARAGAEEVATITFGLGELNLGSGLHRLVFEITEASTGVTATVERVVRVR